MGPILSPEFWMGRSPAGCVVPPRAQSKLPLQPQTPFFLLVSACLNAAPLPHLEVKPELLPLHLLEANDQNHHYHTQICSFLRGLSSKSSLTFPIPLQTCSGQELGHSLAGNLRVSYLQVPKGTHLSSSSAPCLLDRLSPSLSVHQGSLSILAGRTSAQFLASSSWSLPGHTECHLHPWSREHGSLISQAPCC